jgi:hypothetical protein
MPWKNGGGETREILVSPPGAALETLDWRVSLATVAQDGPFSLFKDVQRTLCVIRGGGIQLQVEARAPVDLYVTSAPYTFDGEVPTHARLIDGPIEDLNVMSRRGRFRHSVRRLVLDDALTLETKAQSLIIYCQCGDLGCVAGHESGNLQTNDTAVLTPPAGPIRIDTTTTAEIVVVEFFPE